MTGEYQRLFSETLVETGEAMRYKINPENDSNRRASHIHLDLMPTGHSPSLPALRADLLTQLPSQLSSWHGSDDAEVCLC